MDARRRRRARQHGPHRRGHGRDDRRAAASPGRRPGAARPAPRSSSARRSAPSSCRWLMVRRGRRLGLAAGYAIGVGGALVATSRSSSRRRLPLLLVGTVLIGFGNASNQLSRYAAADLYPGRARASAHRHRRLGRDGRRGRRAEPRRRRPARSRWRSACPSSPAPYLVPIVFVGRGGDPVVRRCCGPIRTSSPTRRRATIRRPTRRRSPCRSRSSSRRPNVPVAIVALVDGPGRDGPDHDDDAAPHDRARPRPRRRSASSSAATRSGCSGCRRSPAA